MSKEIIFSAQDLCDVKSDQLVDRINKLKLNPKAKQIMSNLLIGGYGNGGCVRGFFDNDSPTAGRGYRMDYETAVKKMVAKLPEELKQIALDLALFSYSKGHQNQEAVPEYFREIEAAIGYEKEKSIFDLVQG